MPCTGSSLNITSSRIYGADHLDAATFVQRPNWFDLDQKIKIYSKKISRGVESFKSSKNKLWRCRNDGKLKITQLFLTRLLLIGHICHNYTTIYGILYAIYGRWPNLSGHIKKTPSILHQSKNPLEEWFLSAKGAFLLKDFLISFFLADQFLCTKVAATKWSAPYEIYLSFLWHTGYDILSYGTSKRPRGPAERKGAKYASPTSRWWTALFLYFWCSWALSTLWYPSYCGYTHWRFVKVMK